MNRTLLIPSLLASLAVGISQGALEPKAHFNLQGQGGIRDTAAPETLTNRVQGQKPDLTRSGSPKITTESSPAPRRQVYDSVIKFEGDDQCYSAPVNLANGDNFVLETWALANKADDPNLHTVVANGDGGRGFLLCQNGSQWQVFIGGSGGVNLAKVEAGQWIHLAIVKSQGATAAYINGTRTTALPNLGGGSPNFSIGATSPGKEPFHGWIAEVRYSTFQPGKFDPGSDFLLDVTKTRAIQAEELAKRAKLLSRFIDAEGAVKVTRFDERPYPKDWLITPPTLKSNIQVIPGEGLQSAQIQLANGLVSRTFYLNGENLGCISMRRSDQDIEFIRAIKPEVRISLNGSWVDIGGLTGAPDKAFITPSWFDRLTSPANAFRCVGMKIGPCIKPYEWQSKCGAPQDIAWPANGKRLTFRFLPPETSPLQGLTVDVHYEIYDGIPVIMKTFSILNNSDKDHLVTRFEGEHLAVQPSVSRFLHVESNYSFALANFTELSSGLGIHASGGRAEFKNYYHGGSTTRFVRDPDWGSMATLNPAEDLFLHNPENALLLSQPPTGPNATLKAGETFNAIRTYEILNDEPTGTERSYLAQRRFYRTLAPQTNEKQLEVHAPSTRDPKVLKPLLDQMHEIGFELLQAPEHPGGFNYSDTSPNNISSMKEICDYAKKYNIRVGAYQLVVGSQGWGADIDCIDPVSKRPGSAFGQSVCAASKWGDMYFENMWKVIEQAGMGGYKPDGPYHGDPCASTSHTHHRGLEDSQWEQWKWQTKVLAEGQRRNLYLSIPDWYFLNGQTCTGMGYREATDNIDVALQTVILRQYIYDATFHKTAQMGWINLNTEVLHGGLEKNLDKYERFFFTLLSSGAQVWVRGHRLYDGPESKAMLLKWMAWYRNYYDIIHGDIIHLKRPDGRGLDYYLHVNSKPGAKHKGMLLVFNPSPNEVTQTLNLPLYYTGLTQTANIRQEENPSKAYPLDREYQANLPVKIPANGYTWFIIE